MNDFKDKVVVVTGGGRGIGAMTARRFCEEGAHCVISSNVLSECEECAAELKKDGFSASVMACDVSKPADVDALIADTEKTYGRIDIFANIAGICTSGMNFLGVTPESWDRVMKINAFGTLYTNQKAIESMMRTGTKGNIVNVTSIAAKTGSGAVGVDYSASKAAIVNVTISAATFAARYGIRVNAVAPGPIQTKMTAVWDPKMCAKLVKTIPLGRKFGEPDDISEAIIFLASDKAKYISGEILDVNGAAWCD